MRKDQLQALAAIAVFYIFIEGMGITCPILFVTGISCAGCGMSRAWLSLLQLDFAAAFAFHPLFWLPVPAAGVMLFRRHMPERVYRWCMGIICALFLIVYLYRLLFLNDQVVVFQPAQGVIARVFFRLFGAEV